MHIKGQEEPRLIASSQEWWLLFIILDDLSLPHLCPVLSCAQDKAPSEIAPNGPPLHLWGQKIIVKTENNFIYIFTDYKSNIKEKNGAKKWKNKVEIK